MENIAGNCLLKPGHSMVICQTNPLEHIQEWQSMFTVLPIQGALSILSVLSLLLIMSKFRVWKSFLKLEPLAVIPVPISLLVCFQISNPIKELFSRGILNPKLF